MAVPAADRFPARHLARLLLLFWVIASTAAHATGIEIGRLETRLLGDDYLLDARIDYQFSEAVEEALENGVPLRMDVRVQVVREGAWFWEDGVLDRHLRHQIRFQPLSNLYKVTDIKAEREQNFATREAAISYLGDISGHVLIDRRLLEEGESYLVRLRASLDIGALPLPLRPFAYLSPSWNLSSPWSTWPLQP